MRMEEGPRVTVLSPHLCHVLGMGTRLGSSATPEREWEAGSQLSPSNTPRQLWKKHLLSLLSWLEGPMEQWLPQWQMGNRTAGSWEHNLPTAHPAMSLSTATTGGKISMVMQHSYCTEQPCTLRGTYRECVQKQPVYFTIVQRNEEDISTLYLGEKRSFISCTRILYKRGGTKRAS